MTPLDLNIFEQLKSGGNLPSPKGSALAIIRLTKQEEVSLHDLAHTIKTDPVFCGRLIKAANGANRAGARPIVSIQDAIALLGVPSVRSLALGFSLVSAYRKGMCSNFDYERFWSHSLIRAIALQTLTVATHAAPAEDAFSVGLLFRIGELALATLFPDKYADILHQLRQEPHLRLLDLEQTNFVMTHNVLSASMMLDWGLPNSYVESIYYFETLEEMPFEEGSRPCVLTYLLACGDLVADICLATPEQRGAMLPRLLRLGERLALAPDNLMAICDSAAAEWLAWGPMLRIKTAEVPSFKEISATPETAPDNRRDETEKAAAEQRMRVLIVDDERSMRILLRALLTKGGHEVYEAENGRQGFEMAMELQPHIMIIDWMMPEMDGIELTKLLRETKVGKAIYVLILTSFEEDDKLVEAFAAGADDFMSKPLRPRVLEARLRAGQRIFLLQQASDRDHEEIRQFAAELAVTNRRLQEMALTDSLTGFPNRRYAMERMKQEWGAASRDKRPLSVMVIDLDEFKTINDTYGHDVGDAVLQQASAALKSGLREHDVLCRIGGDEFLVISPGTSLEAALACAERVRSVVRAARYSSGNLRLQRSISIGVAVREDGMSDIDALIKEADRGVYLAKQRGRDQVAAVQSPRR
ncbi:MAG: diguanylate cyclase [Betaproteobacteria bacterium]|nr:diguanylate cyclase [Betaproteobacteria bacterium]